MRLSLASAMLALFGAVSVAPTASADDYGVAYLGLRGSYLLTEDGSTTGSINFDYNEKYATNGYGAALYMGWVLDDSFRLELETGYRNADLDKVTIVNGLAPYSPGDVQKVGGAAQVAIHRPEVAASDPLRKAAFH